MNRYFQHLDGDGVWLATDAAENVAVFTTAGRAPVPSAVLDHIELVRPIEDLVKQIPAEGTHDLIVRSFGNPMDYVEWAWRGFFAYDWQDVHRTDGYTRAYELIARPGRPRSIGDLSAELASAAKLVQLSGIHFADSPAIPVQQFIICEQP